MPSAYVLERLAAAKEEGDVLAQRRRHAASIADSTRKTRREHRQGYVYFFRAANTVKIGFTCNVRERAHSLQTGCPEPGFMCKFLPGTMAREKEMHQRFAEYRIAGEWFELRGRLAKYLERNIHPCDPPEPQPMPVKVVEEFSL